MELWQCSLYEALAEEAGVVLGSDALEHHAEEVLVGLEDALCHGEALDMTDAGDGLELLDQAVVHADGEGSLGAYGAHVEHLNMAAEAHHLVADGVLEAEHDGDGDYHHCQSDGYAEGGDADGRAAHLPAVVVLPVDVACEV